MLPMADGAKIAHLCFVPRDEVEIDDNWHEMGLEATGSKNIVVENAFVPEHRTLAMAAMREPRPLTMAEKARNRRDQTYAARLCTRAVDRLFGAAASKGIFDDNVVQRKFRDLRAANVHIAVNWDLAGTTYGRVSLGLDPITPLI